MVKIFCFWKKSGVNFDQISRDKMRHENGEPLFKKNEKVKSWLSQILTLKVLITGALKSTGPGLGFKLFIRSGTSSSRFLLLLMLTVTSDFLSEVNFPLLSSSESAMLKFCQEIGLWSWFERVRFGQKLLSQRYCVIQLTDNLKKSK